MDDQTSNVHMWNERYKEKELVWSVEANIFLPPIVKNLATGSALDLACGEGRNAIWLARQGWNVTGIDFSPVAIEKAKKIAGDTDVTWVVADLGEYEPESTFDLVLIMYLHLDPARLRSLFSLAADALAPGGSLIAVGHAVRNLTDGVGGPQYPDLLWSKDRIAPLLENLAVVELAEVLRPVNDSDVDAIDLLLHASRP